MSVRLRVRPAPNWPSGLRLRQQWLNAILGGGSISTLHIQPWMTPAGISGLLGALRHIPDTQATLNACVRLLKPGAPLFLVHLYYRFDNRLVGLISERWLARVSNLLGRLKQFVTVFIADNILAAGAYGMAG